MNRAEEVRDLVAQYRLASKRWRDLRPDHFGQKNVDASSRHSRAMAQAYVRLQQLDFEALANKLSNWHKLLRDAPQHLQSTAKRMRQKSIQIALEINADVAKVNESND